MLLDERSPVGVDAARGLYEARSRQPGSRPARDMLAPGVEHDDRRTVWPGGKLMQMLRALLGTTLALTLCAPVAWAQQPHVVTNSALDQAVHQRVAQDQADRTALREFLQQPAVKDVAAKAGLPLDKAEAAVSILQGQDLAQAAAQARTVNSQLAGGASTIVISTTTIIIVLLIVILILALK